MVLVSADVGTFLYREYQAYALFNAKWASEVVNDLQQKQMYMNEKNQALAAALKIKTAINTYLWDDKLGYYIALNTSDAAMKTSSSRITQRTDVMGFPLWAGIPSVEQAKQLRTNIMANDMLSLYGIRSTSSSDAR